MCGLSYLSVCVLSLCCFLWVFFVVSVFLVVCGGGGGGREERRGLQCVAVFKGVSVWECSDVFVVVVVSVFKGWLCVCLSSKGV